MHQSKDARKIQCRWAVKNDHNIHLMKQLQQNYCFFFRSIHSFPITISFFLITLHDFMNCIINLGKKYKSKLNKTKKKEHLSRLSSLKLLVIVSHLFLAWRQCGHCILSLNIFFVHEAILLTCSTFPERWLLFILRHCNCPGPRTLSLFSS